MGSMQKIMTITAGMAEMREQREQAIKDLVSDLEWMEVPIIRVPRPFLPKSAKPGDTFHLLQQIEESSGYTRWYTHDAHEHCAQPWCDRKIGSGPHWTRGRRGTRHGHVNRGEHVYIGTIGNEGILKPHDAAHD